MGKRGVKRCPKCVNNDEVVRILYGEPTELAMQEADEGKIHLGGCCIEIFIDSNGIEKGPLKWHCKSCDVEF